MQITSDQNPITKNSNLFINTFVNHSILIFFYANVLVENQNSGDS